MLTTSLGCNIALDYSVDPYTYQSKVEFIVESLNSDVDVENSFEDHGSGSYIFYKEGMYKITAKIDDQKDSKGSSNEFYVDVKADVIDCSDDFKKIAENPYKNNYVRFYRYNKSDMGKLKITLDCDMEENYDYLYICGLSSADITEQEVYDYLMFKEEPDKGEIVSCDYATGSIKDLDVIVDSPYVMFVMVADPYVDGDFSVTDISRYIPIEEILIAQKDLNQEIHVGDSVEVGITLFPKECDLNNLMIESDNYSIADVDFKDGKLMISGGKVGKTKIYVYNSADIEYDEKGVAVNILENAYVIDVTVVSNKEVPEKLAFVDSEDRIINEMFIERNDMAEIKLNDENWYDYNIQYESSDCTTVNVEDGMMTAVATGSANVTVTIEVPSATDEGEYDTYTATLNVNVTEPDVNDYNNLQSLHNYIKGTEEIYTYTSDKEDVECMNLYFDGRTSFDAGDYITIQDGNGYYYGYDSISGFVITKNAKSEAKLSDEFKIKNTTILNIFPITVYSDTVKIHFITKEAEDTENGNTSANYGFKVRKVEAGAATKKVSVKDMYLDFETYNSSVKHLEITRTPENAIDRLFYKSDDSSIADVDAGGTVYGHADGKTDITVFTANPDLDVKAVANVDVGFKELTGGRFYLSDNNKKTLIQEDSVSLNSNYLETKTIYFDKLPWDASQSFEFEYDKDLIDVQVASDRFYINSLSEKGETEIKIKLPGTDTVLLTIYLTIIKNKEVPEEFKTFDEKVFNAYGNGDIDPAELTEDDISHINYDNSERIYWIYKREGADYVDISFSKKSTIEDRCDWLYLYDLEGNLIGRYTGNKDNVDEETTFVGKTIRVIGEGFILGFVSDRRGTDDGFIVTSIKPYFPEKETPTPTPTPTEAPTPTETATPTPTTASSTSAVTPAHKENTPKIGDTVKESTGKAKYKILTKNTVSYVKPTAKNPKSVVIPVRVTICGKKYKVTEINSKAFYGLKKLKKITIKTKKLKKVGKNAIKKINKKAVIKVPKSKKKKYKKLFQPKTGFKKTMRIKG